MTAAPFCAICGAAFEGDDQYCANCGARRFVPATTIPPWLAEAEPVAVTTPPFGPVTERSRSSEAVAERTPEPPTLPFGFWVAEWSVSGLVGVNVDGDIHIQATGKKEAQLVIKDLRLRKKILVAERAVVKRELAEVKRQHRGAGRGRSAVGRGGGDWGKAIRVFENWGRQADMSRRDRAVAAVEVRIEQYDRRVATVDDLIAQVQIAIAKHEAQ